MNRRNLLLAAIAILSPSLAFSQTLTLKVAGVNRSVALYAPGSGLSNPALVFVLHGLGGDGPGMRSSTQMDKVADREKFVVAYPNAVGGTWDYAGAKNDYAFLKAIIDTAVTLHKVDRNRVYVSGFSQGGGMAVYAAFSYPDVYAAVAPVSSVGSGAPTPKRPIPILLTFGTNDLYTPATFMTSVAGWVKFDSCAATPTVVRPYPATNANSTVTRLTYGGCAQGTEIVVDSIKGGGHEWPMNTATKVNNSEEVWAFFKKFTLSRTTKVARSANTPGTLIASYESGTVRLGGVDGICKVGISGIDGRSIATVVAMDGRFAFPTRNKGIYLLRVGDRPEARTVRMVVP